MINRKSKQVSHQKPYGTWKSHHSYMVLAYLVPLYSRYDGVIAPWDVLNIQEHLVTHCFYCYVFLIDMEEVNFQLKKSWETQKWNFRDSDSWATIRLYHHPSNPAWYIVDWWILKWFVCVFKLGDWFGFKKTRDYRMVASSNAHY